MEAVSTSNLRYNRNVQISRRSLLQSLTAAPLLGAPAKKPNAKAAKDTTPVDLSIEVADAAGHTARISLTKYGVPRRPLEIHILRRADEERQRYPTTYEMVLQTYVMPLADFVQVSPQLDVAHLRSMRLVFDRLVAGTVMVDDIGISARAGPFVTPATP